MKQLKDLIDSDKNKASELEYQSAMSQAHELLIGLEILMSPEIDIPGLVEDMIKKENEIERDLKKLKQQIEELNREEIEIQKEIDLLEMRTKFE